MERTIAVHDKKTFPVNESAECIRQIASYLQNPRRIGMRRDPGDGRAVLSVSAIADPRVALYDTAGRLVAENDNWSAGGATAAALTAAGIRSGAFPLVAPSTLPCSPRYSPAPAPCISPVPPARVAWD